MSSLLSSASASLCGSAVSKAVPQTKVSAPAVVRVQCSAEGAGALSRRQLAAAAACAPLLLPLLPGIALAEKAPKGFKVWTDGVDRYAFYYPFGWQEVTVKGQDVVFKDVIEPLESVAVTIIDTDKESLAEFGTPEQVATAITQTALRSSSQSAKLISAEQRMKNGQPYYSYEFVTQAPNYTRHGLGEVVLNKGKFYTLTTGANERRWSKVQESLKTVVDSFVLL